MPFPRDRWPFICERTVVASLTAIFASQASSGRLARRQFLCWHRAVNNPARIATVPGGPTDLMITQSHESRSGQHPWGCQMVRWWPPQRPCWSVWWRASPRLSSPRLWGCPARCFCCPSSSASLRSLAPPFRRRTYS